MKWRVVLPAALVAALAFGAGSAQAAQESVTGLGEVTHVVTCPNAFKIPLAGTGSDGEWSFTLTGVHLTCVLGYGKPVTFQGSWDPATGSTCDTLGLGAGCMTSTDPARPGYLSLGAVPDRLALTATPIHFCLSGSCWSGTAFVERA